MFSITVWLLNRLKFWKTIPMCCLILSILIFGSVIRSPSNQISPLVGTSSRFRHRRTVDLPEPEGPITTIFSP